MCKAEGYHRFDWSQCQSFVKGDPLRVEAVLLGGLKGEGQAFRAGGLCLALWQDEPQGDDRLLRLVHRRRRQIQSIFKSSIFKSEFKNLLQM